MVLVINQETFDAAVEENITEFEMSREEAIEDAIKQFQAQGVDLSNILKKQLILNPEDSQVLSTAITELGKLIKSNNKVPFSDYENRLSLIKTECDKGLEYKVLAGKEGAYSIILDILVKNLDDLNLTKIALSCMLSLVTQQPDLLDASGIQAMIDYLDKSDDQEIHGLVLRWIKACCVMHEENRQKIFDCGILIRLKVLFDKQDAEMLRDILAVIRALILDDDVRVEFGKSHEHARIIANETLCSLASMLSKFKHESLIIDMLQTISLLLVRTEFCIMVEEVGGVDAVKDIMVLFHEKDKVIRHCFKLLKALSGHDDVKVGIIQKQLAPIITASLDMHKGFVQTAAAGLSCIAALSLRSPENSKAFYDAGIPEVIVNTMKQNLDDANIQRNGSWAIRNMVSRSRYQNEMFLEFGIEEILIQSLKNFPQHEYDIKSALRDLGCKVQLKEEWTGKGGQINTEAK